jgi:membrane protease YdiL (CAAX protease family)
MLSAKPWTVNAVLRLLLGFFVCVYGAGLAGALRVFKAEAAGPRAELFYVIVGLALFCLVISLVLLDKPWELETFMPRILAFLICFYGGILGGMWAQKLVGKPAPSAAQIVIGSIGLHGAGVFLVWRFLHWHRETWAQGFGFQNQWRRCLFLGVCAALFFLPVGWSLQNLSAFVMTHVSGKLPPTEQQAIQVLRATQSWGPRVLVGAMAIFLAPVTEELVFRGILYPVIKQRGYPRLALWGTAFIFAAIHVNLVTFVPLFALAVLLTLLYDWTDNLLAPITAHAAFNALNFATLWLFPPPAS